MAHTQRCNNMHTLCSGQPKLQAGDNYLAGLVPQILNSPLFQTTNSALVITFDEGNGYCSLNGSGEDCVYTAWAGPAAKKGFGSSILYNHYSLLATIEKVWDLPNLTSHDSGGSAMTEFLQNGSIAAPPPTTSSPGPLGPGNGLQGFLLAATVGPILVLATVFLLRRRRRRAISDSQTRLNDDSPV